MDFALRCHRDYTVRQFLWYDDALLTLARQVPLMQPHPGQHSVLVGDNFSTHWCQDFLDACALGNVVCDHTPPYSPDLTPIELAFSKIKAYLARHCSRLSHVRPWAGGV